MSARIAGLLLAAGRSTRMGAPKLSEIHAGRTLAEHALGAFTDAGLGAIVIVASPEPSAYQLFPHGVGEAAVTLNPSPARGLSSSLRLGLASLPPVAEAVVIGLADMPCVQATTIHALMAAWRSDLDAAAPIHDGNRGSPVLVNLVWARHVAASLDGDHGLGRAIEALGPGLLRVELDDPGVLFDVDTPDDLARWREG